MLRGASCYPVRAIRVNRAMNQLQTLLNDAKSQLGANVIYNKDDSVRHIIPKAPASVSTLLLRDLTLPPFLAADADNSIYTPLGTEAGKKTKLSTAIMKASRVAKAGAKIIVVEQSGEAIPIGNGEVVMTRRTNGFTLVEPAKFSQVDDDKELTKSPLPVFRSEVDMDTMPGFGFRVELSRAEQKSYEDGKLADITLAAIAMGVARVADMVLLKAIEAKNPSPFSLGGVAALGYEFGELRALVGTTAPGAVVGHDGVLRAAGVLAELTPDISTTLVGSWSRSAVAVHEEITLVVERLDVSGKMAITCWCHAQAMLPNPAAFWTVGGV